MIKGKRVTLRGLEVEDAEAILAHFNDLEFRQYLGPPLPISKDEEEQWIRNTWEARQKGTDYHFGIEHNKTRQLFGTCGLVSVHRINRSAEMGIGIWNKQFWNQGYGTEALILLLSYGFYLLNLHSIYLRVHDFNKRAIRVYEKLGFKLVARQREAVFVNGEFKDTLMMDLLEDEFRQLHPPAPPFIESEGE